MSSHGIMKQVIGTAPGRMNVYPSFPLIIKKRRRGYPLLDHKELSPGKAVGASDFVRLADGGGVGEGGDEEGGQQRPRPSHVDRHAPHALRRETDGRERRPRLAPVVAAVEAAAAEVGERAAEFVEILPAAPPGARRISS